MHCFILVETARGLPFLLMARAPPSVLFCSLDFPHIEARPTKLVLQAMFQSSRSKISYVASITAAGLRLRVAQQPVRYFSV